MAVTLLLCAVLFFERLTGEAVHSVLGVLLAVIAAVHIGKYPRKMRYRNMPVRVVDQVLMAALAVLLVTGVLLHPLHGMLFMKLLHKSSAVLFVIGVILHMVQHNSR